MEKSPQYRERLQTIRSLPQKTEAEAGEKKEQAKLFRMEVLLDNAQCTRLVTNALLENPAIEPEELEQIAQTSEFLAHPEVMDAYIKQLIETRDRVMAGIEKLKEESRVNKQGMSRALFNWILPEKLKGQKPRGKVRLGGAFPLAIMLDVEDSRDYHDINPAKNSNYQGGGVIFSQKQEENEKYFPFIVVHGIEADEYMDLLEYYSFPSAKGAKKHEKGHAEQNAIIETLKNCQKKCVWSEFSEKDPIKNGNELLEEWVDFETEPWSIKEDWASDPKKYKSTEAWKKIMDYALSQAKDEILAHINAYDYDIESHVNTLADPNGPYQFFKKTRLNLNGPIGKALKEEYIIQVEKAYQAIKPILQAYAQMGLEERLKNFRLILAQIPLNKWESQLNQTLFTEDAQRLLQIQEQCRKHDLALEDWRKRWAAYLEFDSELKEHQNQPFFDIINRFEQKLAA